MNTIKVAELFAGVGGFRLGLEGYDNKDHPEFHMPCAGPFKTVWADQWEPPGNSAKQFAWRCYEERFGKGSCTNVDIAQVLDDLEAGTDDHGIPDEIDMVVGGFPCQDYSVAKPLSKAGGIEGKKGVLWWEIYKLLSIKEPKYVLLENVDRLLKSPASQRGRDFAIILSCLSALGYSVEWRVVNSAEYGFPQRRKRIFIYGEHDAGKWDLEKRILDGVLASALPIEQKGDLHKLNIPEDAYEATMQFNLQTPKSSPFKTAGVMQSQIALTCDTEASFAGKRLMLKDVLVDLNEVPENYFVPEDKVDRWKYLKGAKSEERVNRTTGYKYRYSEGAMSFPDKLDEPSRTILTGEGGSGPSRFKHVVEANGSLRRLVPDELDQLQGFPKGWTNTGMTDSQRAFCMGNALVVGIPHLIGKEIASRANKQ